MSSNIFTLSDLGPGGRLYRPSKTVTLQESSLAIQRETGAALRAGDVGIQDLQEIGSINQNLFSRLDELNQRTDEMIQRFQILPEENINASYNMTYVFWGVLLTLLAGLGICALLA